MSEPKMGGQPRLRLLVKGEDDLIDSVLSVREGGAKLQTGLVDMVREAYQGAYQLEIAREPGVSSANLLAQLRGEGQDTLLRTWEPDVVVLSLSSDVDGDQARFKDDMQEAIQLLKEQIGTHVIVMNCSSVDPADRVTSYHGVSDPVAVRIHRLNLALIQLSMLEGISIVDVDRLLAQMGAASHVREALDYSPEACAAICGELLRVLADYGFFEERPLVAQLGKRGA